MDPAQALGPGDKAGDMINTYAQDLGIQSRKQSTFSFVRRDLACSYRRPGQWVERQHHVLPAQIAERDVFSKVAGEGEIGS